ncbi:MAG: HEAT repeat domain-containing protein [Deltaproteobacteria bacterium]|nr:HEAT repeat domain-containing protein [Deltaproteobacteria bacterium]
MVQKEIPDSGASQPDKPAEESPPVADDLAQIAAVKEFFNQLKKSIKTIGLHRHAVQNYEEFLKPAYEALSKYFEQYDEVTMTVEQTSLKFLKETIFEEEVTDHNLAFKFYREGVRLLLFRKGMSSKELLDFVLVSLTNVKPGNILQDDLISLMWEKDFKHIDYIKVESYSFGDESEEESRLEIDKVIAFLYQRLTSLTSDNYKFARISLEDLELEFDNIHQSASLKTNGKAAREELKTNIQQIVTKYEQTGLRLRVLDILLRLFEEELDEELGQILHDSFLQLIDSFLLQEDFFGVDKIFGDFRALENRQIPEASAPWVHKTFADLVQRMCDDDTIVKMAEILDRTTDQDTYQKVERYLTHLRQPAPVPILQALEGITRKEARELLCDILAAHGKDDIDLFVSRLSSNKANLVRDMLYILDKINPPDKLKHVASLLSHPNLALRMQALKSIGASRDPTACGYLTKALQDKDAQVRMTAAMVLPDLDPKTAFGYLLPLAKSPDFREKPDREQVAVFTGLAKTGQQQAFRKARSRTSGCLYRLG